MDVYRKKYTTAKIIAINIALPKDDTSPMTTPLSVELPCADIVESEVDTGCIDELAIVASFDFEETTSPPTNRSMLDTISDAGSWLSVEVAKDDAAPRTWASILCPSS